MAEPQSEKDAAAQQKKKEEEVRCYGCRTLAGNRVGLSCDQGHWLCPDCLRNFLRTQLELGTVPFKCMICKTVLWDKLLMAVMLPEELERYQTLVVFSSLMPNETFVTCPFCPFGAIYDKKDTPLLYFCQRAPCKKRSCSVCFLEFDEKSAMGHLKRCGKFGALKRQLEAVIEAGTKAVCPAGCGLTGMKDDNCTRMQCSRCASRWCYLCGQEEKACDKPSSSGWEIGHQEDWKKNPLRCPLYLQEIKNVDVKWPGTAKEALEVFHRERTLRLLQVEVKKIGLKDVQELVGAYPHLLAGYPLDEIQAFQDRPYFAKKLQALGAQKAKQAKK